MKVRHQVFYSGRVQGVGFRYTVKQIASGYEVIGWVRNLGDGRVEVQAEGENQEVDAFLSAVRASQLALYIKDMEQNALDLQSGTPNGNGAKGFAILAE